MCLWKKEKVLRVTINEYVTEIKEQNSGLRNKTGRILRKSPEQNFTVTQM